MRRLILATSFLFLVAIPLSAQEKSDASSKPIDATNMSKSESIVGSSVVTKSEVDGLWSELQKKFSEKDCEFVVDYAMNFSTRANFLANIIHTGLEPYYSGDYKKRERFSPTQELIAMERAKNYYIGLRDESWVMRAECLMQLDRSQEAAVMFAHALDYIDMEDADLWRRARDGVWKIIGVK